ncbi:hypothetical protein ACTFIZ_004282 [Dictyostelium cf. discoideum]
MKLISILFLLISILVFLKNVESAKHCPPGFELCNGEECFNPSEGQRCSQIGLLCAYSYLPCGDVCYMPSTGKRCYPGGLVCPKNHIPCGKTCYNPSAGQKCLTH